MAGFKNFNSMTSAIVDAGQEWYTTFRKTPGNLTATGVWFDLSMTPGNPKANFYIGAQFESTALNGNFGIYHGQGVGTGYRKFIKSIGMMVPAATPATFTLLDYLLFYPLIDMDDSNEQGLDNVISLPRYSTGVGVKAMLVATNPYIGGGTVTITYTNSAGVSGRTSTMNTSTTGSIGTLVGASSSTQTGGPFFPLMSGDVGIRSVESIRFSQAIGGIGALVLVKPLANICALEAGTWNEIDYAIETTSYPVVQDGAYLGFIGMSTGSIGTFSIIGNCTFIWG